MIPPTVTRDSVAFAGIELELLRQTSINESASGIVSKAGIANPISAFTPCFRRVLTKYVVAFNYESNHCDSVWRAEAELGLQVSPEPIHEPVLLDRSLFGGGQRFRFLHVVV